MNNRFVWINWSYSQSNICSVLLSNVHSQNKQPRLSKQSETFSHDCLSPFLADSICCLFCSCLWPAWLCCCWMSCSKRAMVLVQGSRCSSLPTSVRRSSGRPSAPRLWTPEEVRNPRVVGECGILFNNRQSSDQSPSHCSSALHRTEPHSCDFFCF